MISLLTVVLSTSCAPAGGTPTPAPKAQAPVAGGSTPSKQWSSPPAMAIDANKQYSATITTGLGDMKAQLFSKEAPNTVNNFVFLVRQGFYEGVPFHRVIAGFMVQTGDPTGTGRGGPGYRFADELPKDREYEVGTLAMANAGPNTQGSQFFICHGDLRGKLPKNYTIFGKLTDGIEVLNSIASIPVKASPSGEPSAPTQEVQIKSITIQES